MALSCVWYMSDVDEAAGGTFGKPPDLTCLAFDVLSTADFPICSGASIAS